MGPLETWEQVLIGVFALLLILFVFPGLKTLLKRSKEAETDWPGLLLPIGLVVLFVIFLISMV